MTSASVIATRAGNAEFGEDRVLSSGVLLFYSEFRAREIGLEARAVLLTRSCASCFRRDAAFNYFVRGLRTGYVGWLFAAAMVGSRFCCSVRLIITRAIGIFVR